MRSSWFPETPERYKYSPGEFLSNVNTTTPGTATAVPSPSDTLICGVPCHAQCVAHNTRICLLACCETSACIPAASTPGRSAVVSSPSTEMGATVAASYSYPPSRLPDWTHWSYPHIGHIHPRGFALASGTSALLDTVLGPTGQHPSRFGVLVKLGRLRCPARPLPV